MHSLLALVSPTLNLMTANQDEGFIENSCFTVEFATSLTRAFTIVTLILRLANVAIAETECAVG